MHQNQGRALERCLNHPSLVISPATLRSSSVISWSVARYSGSIERCWSALRAHRYVVWHFRASASSLWTLTQAWVVVCWLSALHTSVQKHSDFSPRAKWSPSRASITCILQSSALTVAINSRDRRSISPGPSAEGRVMRSPSGANQPSGSNSKASSDPSGSQSRTCKSYTDHLTSSSSLMMTAIHCS